MDIKSMMSGELFALLFVIVVLMVGVPYIPSDVAGPGVGPLEEWSEPNVFEEPTFIFSAKDERYNFALGSAVVPDSFRQDLLRNHVREFARRSRLAGYTTCEIIGHTDESPVGSSMALDDRVFVSEVGKGNFGNLAAGSNVELGMLRALAVAEILEEARRKGKLGEIRFIKAYSAGQLVKLNHTRADGNGGADVTRRRIEIRLVKEKAYETGGKNRLAWLWER